MTAGSKPIPPKPAAPLSPALFAVVVLGATAVGAGTMVYCFDPSTHRFYPVCLFHALTGLNCPGCGMTRSLYALLHGNLRLALKDNALFILLLAAGVIWAMRLVVQKFRNQPATLGVSPKFLWLMFGVALIFAVVRNLPGFAWLSP